jgi:hypothetical protein
LEKKWKTVDSAQKEKFKAAVQKFETLGHCVENWSGGWGSRKIIELRSDITDIDFLFAIAEIVNNPIQNFVDEQVKCVFGPNSSVYLIPGPVKRPSRAIAYALNPPFTSVTSTTLIPSHPKVLSSITLIVLAAKCIEFTEEMYPN